MISKRSHRYAACPQSGKNYVELSIFTGQQEFFAVDDERISRLMEVAHEVYPSGKLKLFIRISRFSGKNAHRTELDVLFVILESTLAAFAQRVIHVDVRIQTPPGGKIQDVVIVLVFFIVERALVAEVLRNCVSEIPYGAVRHVPAEESITLAGRGRHVIVVDGRAVGRPETAAL